MIQAGAVFEQYDVLVIRHVTDVRNHDCLQRTHDWPPSIKEISTACDAESARQERQRQAAMAPKPVFNRPYVPPPKFPGCRTNLLVHRDAPGYDALDALVNSGTLDDCDWARVPEGIRVGLSIWQNMALHRRMLGPGWKPMSDAELYAHYGRREAEAAKQPAQEAAP